MVTNSDDLDNVINTPDSIVDINGSAHYFDDSDAIPFAYDPSDGSFYMGFGSNGSMHRDMFLFEFDKDRTETQYLITNACCGRYWKSVNTFSVWKWDENMVKTIGKLLIQELGRPELLKTLKVGAPQQTILFSDLSSYKQQSNDNNTDQEKLDNLQAIHLMNAHDKRKAMEGYLSDRSNNIGKKLSYSNGQGEMSMAQYRALHSTSENKQMQKKLSIQERVDHVFNQLLTENKESKNLSKARNYIRQVRPQADAQQMVDAIRTNIPNSRIANCKFLVGIARMLLNNELTDQSVIANLNKVLKYIGSEAHVNEYDSNLNDETAETLIQRFAGASQQDLTKSKNTVDQEEYQENHRYQIVPIDGFGEAEEYGEYTSWCVTQNPEAFQQYTHGGTGRFYFCLRDDYQTIPQERGENCPLDDYGLSMIAVSVNDDGSVNTITCRWNHDNGGNDNIMTDQELSRVIGRNFYQTFKPYTPEELGQKKRYILDEFEDFISNYGDDEFVQSSFDILEPEDGDEEGRKMYVVRSSNYPELAEQVDDVYMVFNQDLEPVIDEFFEDTHDFLPFDVSYDEIGIGVCKQGHWNVLKGDGTLLIPGAPNAWPTRITDVSVLTGNYVQCTFQNGEISIIRIVDGKPMLEHIKDMQYFENGAAFFSYDMKSYFFYNLVNNEVVLQNIEMPQNTRYSSHHTEVSTDMRDISCFTGCIFPLKPIGSQGCYLYYREKGNRLIRLSNLPFTRLVDRHDDNYEVVNAQGQHFIIKTNLTNGGAYDMNGNRIEPQPRESRQRMIDRIISEEIKRHLR